MAGTAVPATGIAWDPTIPDNGQVHGNDYNEHRETKLAVAIRNDKEHVAFAGSSVGGEHKPGSARIYRGDYTTTVAGDNLPTTKPDGATALDANDAGMLAHDTDATLGNIYYEWNGTGWDAIDLIITNIANSVKDEDNMASDSASHVPTQQSVKAFTEARTTMVPAITGAGTGYAGEESVTHANGQIVKDGSEAIGATSGIVTFAVPFPNALKSIQLTLVETSGFTTDSVTISASSVSSFTWNVPNSVRESFFWTAKGY